MITNAREALRCPKCEGASIFTGYCLGETYRRSFQPEDTLHCIKAPEGEHLHRTCICGFEWITPCADGGEKADASGSFGIYQDLTVRA